MAADESVILAGVPGNFYSFAAFPWASAYGTDYVIGR
jgi:hypothetical protein